MAMLEFSDVEVFYCKVQALRGLNLSVQEGEIVSLLGNNGAGKTTTLSAASALVKPKTGSIVFNGKDISSEDPWNVVAAGLRRMVICMAYSSAVTAATNAAWLS